MLRDTILAAALAAIVAALVYTGVQSFWVTPLILQAETFEQSTPEEHAHAADHGHGHSHEHDDWAPQDGVERAAFTFAANLLMALGYALLLFAVYFLWREPDGAVWGALYGLGGFAAFFIAPALGLPPELPGMPAADVGARQQWWILIAAATVAGLLMLFSRRPAWFKAIGVLLITAPHLLPAPAPESHATLVPGDLLHRFQMMSGLTNAIFWLVLGVASSAAFKKMVSHRDALSQ